MSCPNFIPFDDHTYIVIDQCSEKFDQHIAEKIKLGWSVFIICRPDQARSAVFIPPGDLYWQDFFKFTDRIPNYPAPGPSSIDERFPVKDLESVKQYLSREIARTEGCIGFNERMNHARLVEELREHLKTLESLKMTLEFEK